MARVALLLCTAASLVALSTGDAVAASCDRLAGPIFDGGGYRYDFTAGLAGSYGEPEEGGSNGPMDLPPGPVRTIDAWDDWGNVLVFAPGADLTKPTAGDRYSGAADGCSFGLGGQEIAYPEATLHELRVEHRWFVDPGPLHGARILTVLRNPGVLPISVSVTQGDPSGFDGIGSDEETTVRASSDGTATFSPASAWGVTTDERAPNPNPLLAPDPALAHVWDGRGGAVRVSQAVVGDAGILYWAWNVTVPPGQAAAFISYEIQAAVPSRDRAAEVAEAVAQAEARQKQPPTSLYLGMSTHEIAATMNWPHPAPTVTIASVGRASAARQVQLDGGASVGAAGLPQCPIARYSWEADDGATDSHPAFAHFFGPGRHSATLTVVNTCNGVRSARTTFDVSPGIQLGKLKLNRRTGTALLQVKALGAGRLTLGGRGLRKQARQMKRAGLVSLTLRPAGKALAALRRRGRARVRAEVTLLPPGGKLSKLRKRVTLKLRD
jgi:hypothetical protein